MHIQDEIFRSAGWQIDRAGAKYRSVSNIKEISPISALFVFSYSLFYKNNFNCQSQSQSQNFFQDPLTEGMRIIQIYK